MYTVLGERYLRELAILSARLPSTGGHGHAAQVSRERIADRCGMCSGSLSGECFVTDEALAHALAELHERLSRLV